MSHLKTDIFDILYTSTYARTHPRLRTRT